MDINIKKGRYHHYKGHDYQVIGMATHSESVEPMVIYRQLYGNLGTWVRPAGMWNEDVEHEGRTVKRFEYAGPCITSPIEDLWSEGQEADWAIAYLHYYELVDNRELEEELENLSSDDVKKMDGEAFYRFLYEKYYAWKYTEIRRLVRNRSLLSDFYNNEGKKELPRIHDALFDDNREDIARLFRLLSPIKGLGPAGISGLLAILWPREFGTVDQFVVKALRCVRDIPDEEKLLLASMKPDNIRPVDAALLIRIMRRKATQLNKAFGTDFWTPRAVDMVLWSSR